MSADIEKIVEIGARALAPLAWAALEAGDTLAQKNRRTASIRHARALLSTLTAAGYAVLPREPTEEMIEAGMWPTEDKSTAELMYRAMVEAFSPVKGSEGGS